MSSLRLARIAFISVSLLLLGACGGPAPESGESTAARATPADAERAAAERMQREHAHDAPVATPAVASPPRSAVTARPIEYGREGERPLTGYLALPAAAAGQPLPGIIVIHEWWGLNENIRAMTERLAGEGYAALAVDLYMGRSADDPEGGATLMRELMGERERGWRNLRQAHDFLADSLEAPAVAALGWCLGGRWALEAARALPEVLDAVVIYYGNVPSEAEVLAPLDMPILGLFAEDDAAVPLDGVLAFRDRLAELGKNAHIEIYPGVDHAFANPSGGNYHPETAEDAWQRTLAFLAAHLKDEDGLD